jgi:hypothetical protein
MTSIENSAVAIRDVADIEKLGELFERSGMFGCSQQGQGVVLAMTCMMERMSPIRVNQTYHIIDGRLSMKADAMLAKFNERGGRHKILEVSASRAAAVFTKDDNVFEAEYTMAEAEAAGICYGRDNKLKANWQKFPKDMLWARLVSGTIRKLDPGVNMGTYAPEEIQDMDDVPTAKKYVPPEPAKAVKVESVKPIKQEPAAPEKKPEVIQPEIVSVDPTIVPAGKLKGTPMTELTDKNLQTVIDVNHPAFTDAHKAEARRVLESRKQA